MNAKKVAVAIEAARAAGTAAASDWEVESGVSIDDHRLRSLMNFERDVVKSTANDIEALPLWRAFVGAFDALDRGTAIHMDAKRGFRLRSAIESACDVLDSLRSIIPLFPRAQTGLGEVDPEIAVNGFLSVLDPITSLMLAMVNYEEEGQKYPGLLDKLKEIGDD